MTATKLSTIFNFDIYILFFSFVLMKKVFFQHILDSNRIRMDPNNELAAEENGWGFYHVLS